MSRIRADYITNLAGTGAPEFSKGAVISGVVTATSFAATNLEVSTGGVSVTGVVTAPSFKGTLIGASSASSALIGSPDTTVNNLIGVAATFSGNVSVGGTLTYEDVTNVDSVGLITARSGLDVGSTTTDALVKVYGGSTDNVFEAHQEGTGAKLTITGGGNLTSTGIIEDSKGDVRDITLRSVSGSQATLALTDAGKVVSTNTTGWTVPGLSWAAGDTVTLLNNSAGDLTITCSAVTTYLTSDGSTVTSKLLGARGMATLYFTASNVCYLQGTSLS